MHLRQPLPAQASARLYAGNICAQCPARASPSSNIVVAVVGVALLIFTVQRAGGWAAVVAGIASVGWWFVVVVLLGAVRMACRARVRGIDLRSDDRASCGFGDAFGAWLAGDAVGNLTPLGLLASEPTKILMVRTRISTVDEHRVGHDRERVLHRVGLGRAARPAPGCSCSAPNVPAGLEQISEVDPRRRIAMAAVARHLGRAHAAGGPVAACAARSRSWPAAPKRRPTRCATSSRRSTACRSGRSAASRTSRCGKSRFMSPPSPKCGWCSRLLVPATITHRRGVPAGERRAVRHRGVQVRPVSPGHRRSRLRRRRRRPRLRPAIGVTLALVRRLRIIVLNAFGV